jgi:hypothetical protein
MKFVSSHPWLVKSSCKTCFQWSEMKWPQGWSGSQSCSCDEGLKSLQLIITNPYLCNISKLFANFVLQDLYIIIKINFKFYAIFNFILFSLHQLKNIKMTFAEFKAPGIKEACPTMKNCLLAVNECIFLLLGELLSCRFLASSIPIASWSCEFSL